MSDFIEALLNPAFPFIRNALLAGLLSSVLFGVLGSIVTVRRIASLAGAVSHAVLGGIGMALYLSASGLVPGFPPMAGALIFAVISAGLIGVVSLKAKQREDTVINSIWAIGMSAGVLFMAKTAGYTDPSSYLFGNILLISTRDLILMAILDILVLFLAWRFYPQLEASSFDEEFARVRGVPTTTLFLILLTVTAVAIVLLQTFVGIVMVIAMLTLPAGTAGYSAKSLSGMMILSCVFSALFSAGGLALGWSFDLPVGAITVMLAGAVFLITGAVRGVLRRR
ncbi:ABC-type transport system, permease component [Treponema primitia ZAS-2]|uniref:ABC-type transport system, permease component n=1 Tax=Treponema primitia (strain ATCC BAA-887 / DSM 12427 / ZAS-2) TaxID=545694 RepID=F5YLP6_TREPZ|nr:metal ABC transporter permease [Treponema primitia]AEF84105.1 ABC-type transport system, permease component [Treponema primitia ZAS-2]